METIVQQKQELVRLIESVNDPSVLEAVKGLLNESESIYAWKETLDFLADEAEKDIKLGNVYLSEEFKAKIDAKLASSK
jgi:hypothetical protein